ncbi:hypothetical protein SUGI_0175380 [Cryptomeria japonica]|nr:hypothetical protein SUGI_0175380 [Cryptomeria japonica]
MDLGLKGTSFPSTLVDTRIYASALNGSTFSVSHSSSIPKVRMDGLVGDREEFIQQNALICRFTKVWPKLSDLRSWFSKIWGQSLEDEICLFPYARGFFIIEFESNNDKEWVLKNGAWIYHGDFLCMKPWYPAFDPRNEMFSSSFFWVKLPYLLF